MRIVGRSPDLPRTCQPLSEYTWIVDRIRKFVHTNELEAAIDQTIDAMPDEFGTKPFLETHRAEVKTMLLTEYNEARQIGRISTGNFRSTDNYISGLSQ